MNLFLINGFFARMVPLCCEAERITVCTKAEGQKAASNARFRTRKVQLRAKTNPDPNTQAFDYAQGLGFFTVDCLVPITNTLFQPRSIGPTPLVLDFKAAADSVAQA